MRTILGKRHLSALVVFALLGSALGSAAQAEINFKPRGSGEAYSIGLAPAFMRVPRLRGADLARELRCLALNIYWEARSEPGNSQLAVAMVTLNRVASDEFPDTICGVVRQGGYKRAKRCQFSWYCDGKSDDPGNAKAWRHAKAIAYKAAFHATYDPTRGALWYHADYVKPRWARSLRRTVRIGRHLYYRES